MVWAQGLQLSIAHSHDIPVGQGQAICRIYSTQIHILQLTPGLGPVCSQLDCRNAFEA